MMMIFFITGLAVMSRLARNRLHESYDFEDRTIDWDSAAM